MAVIGEAVYYFEMLGTAVFAITGVLVVSRRGLDVFGAAVLGMVTALGGGTARDVMIRAPIFWIEDVNYVWAAVAGALAAFWIGALFRSTQGALLPGREVRLALEQAGLVPGPQSIYHLADAQGAVLVSAANMLRPGDLDPALVDEQQLRGLSLFTVLPGPMAPVRMLEELVAVGRAISWRLGATVQDEHGTELDGEALVKLRQSLPDGAENGAP